MVRTTAAHPFLTDQGWRPLAELTTGTRIAVAARLPYFGHQPLPGGELLLLAHFLGDGGLRGTEEQRRDEAVSGAGPWTSTASPCCAATACSTPTTARWRSRPPSPACPAEQLLRFLERLLEANRHVRPGRQTRVSFVARSEPLVRACSTCCCASA